MLLCAPRIGISYQPAKRPCRGPFAGIFSAALSCSTLPCHWMLVRCEVDPECFRLAEEVLLRQFAKAAFDAATDVILSAEEAEADEVMTGLVPEVTAADLL